MIIVLLWVGEVDRDSVGAPLLEFIAVDGTLGQE